MAISERTPSEVMTEKLRRVLQQARSVKPSTTIDPPLQVSALVPGNEGVFGPISGDKDSHMVAMEDAARNIFYDKLVG